VNGEGTHKKLKVWQESIELVLQLYRHLDGFPKDERFGLVAQLQRAAVSIPSNIAEGAARRNTKEYLQFLFIARGSLSEVDTQLDIAFKLGYLNNSSYERLSEKLTGISKMLNGLINSLESTGKR
jgi:four helix bundle protein